MADGSEPNEREDAIARAWACLEQHEATHPGQPYATALRLRRSRPKAGVATLSRELNEKLGVSLSASEFRKVLYAARRKYLDVYDGPN